MILEKYQSNFELTVEPLGVELGRSERGRWAEGPVDHSISSHEVHDGPCIKVPILCEQGSCVVMRVVGTSCNTRHLIHNLGKVVFLQDEK